MIRLMNVRRNGEDDPKHDTATECDEPSNRNDEAGTGGYYYDDTTGYEPFCEDDEESDDATSSVAPDSSRPDI